MCPSRTHRAVTHDSPPRAHPPPRNFGLRERSYRFAASALRTTAQPRSTPNPGNTAAAPPIQICRDASGIGRPACGFLLHKQNTSKNSLLLPPSTASAFSPLWSRRTQRLLTASDSVRSQRTFTPRADSSPQSPCQRVLPAAKRGQPFHLRRPKLSGMSDPRSDDA